MAIKTKLKIFSISGITAVATLILLLLTITEKASSLISQAASGPEKKDSRRYKVNRIIEQDSIKIEKAFNINNQNER